MNFFPTKTSKFRDSSEMKNIPCQSRSYNPKVQFFPINNNYFMTLFKMFRLFLLGTVLLVRKKFNHLNNAANNSLIIRDNQLIFASFHSANIPVLKNVKKTFFFQTKTVKNAELLTTLSHLLLLRKISVHIDQKSKSKLCTHSYQLIILVLCPLKQMFVCLVHNGNTRMW